MRCITLMAILALVGCGTSPDDGAGDKTEESSTRTSSQKDARVLFVIAHQGFRDEEFSEPAGIVEKNGYAYQVASTDTAIATGMLGAKVNPDLLISQAQSSDYDALVIVGGVGIRKLWQDTSLIRLTQDFAQADKILGAICLAPVVLGNAGLLKDVKATCYEDASEDLASTGAVYTGEDVECSGKILTGSGPRAARAFGEKLVELLASSEEESQ